MWKKLRYADYRHWISIALILGSLALCFFCYQYPIQRLIEAGEAFGRSVAYTFLDLFELGEDAAIEQTVNQYSNVDLNAAIGIDLETLYAKLTGVWSQIFVWEHFRAYLVFLLWHFIRFTYYGCMVLLLGILAAMPVMLTWDEINNDYNEDTKPLVLFKRFIAAPWRRVWAWCKSFWRFFADRIYMPLFVGIWLLNFGVYSVVLSFLAYYFWILVAFDFSTIGVQLVKLIVDVLLALNTLPWYAWAVIFVWIWDRWRLAHAADKMQHLELQNKELLNEMPMCSFCTAPPRTGKTTIITDMALSYSAMFRHKALELMTGNMHKFPRFPWILFELDLQRAIREHRVYNLVTARSWVGGKWLQYVCNPQQERIWEYDTDLYPITYNDRLTVLSLWQALENYAQEFFIYFLQTSILVSSYAVREDFIFIDEGNFPLVDTDFFGREPEEIHDVSTYAHIIDFDMLRLGKKMIEENPHVGGLEFGVILIPEIDKERKNDLRLRELKVKEGECTQKNDLFNEWMKMAGQSAMVENYCFLRILSDAQRPSSWGADARELSIVLHIEKKGDAANGLPLFWIEDALIGKYLSWWENVYANSRFKWGNNRLITWMGEGLASLLYGYRLRRNNEYGYWRQNILTESGTLEKENVEEHRYTVARKKAFSQRFATDHFKAYSQVQTEKCDRGLNDLPSFASIYPSFDEMIIQNSHFCKELVQYFDIITKEKK